MTLLALLMWMSKIFILEMPKLSVCLKTVSTFIITENPRLRLDAKTMFDIRNWEQFQFWIGQEHQKVWLRNPFTQQHLVKELSDLSV